MRIRTFIAKMLMPMMVFALAFVAVFIVAYGISGFLFGFDPVNTVNFLLKTLFFAVISLVAGFVFVLITESDNI